MEIKLTLEQVKPLVLDALRARLVPFIKSSPGIGKSALAAAIAEEFDLELVDIRLSQMDPVELNGFPTMKDNRASYTPMDLFPLEDTPVPEGKKGWLILLDEINSAPKSVEAAAYKLLHDRKVGMHSLNKKVAMMAAGNLITDKAIVNTASTATKSRLLHFEIKADHKTWIKWADKNDIDHRVKSFINFKPACLHRFDTNHDEDTFPCPRTWEYVSRLIAPYPDLGMDKLALVASAVGDGMGREFHAYSKIYSSIPTIGAITSNPEGIPVPNEPSIQHALTGLISHHLTTHNADSLMKFLSRLNIDFQVIALRSAIAKNLKIRKHPAVMAWVSRNAKELAN